jgi:hypothetical protein
MARDCAVRILVSLFIGCLCAIGVNAQQTETFDSLFAKLSRAYGASQNDRVLRARMTCITSLSQFSE